MEDKQPLKNEDGSVLVVALMILVLLTLLGISITTTTEVEINIAGNEKLYKENLYNAEGGAMECAQRMQDAATLSPAVQNWLKAYGTVSLNNIRSNTYWNGNGQVCAVDANTRFLAVEEGVISDSVVMTRSRLRTYTIYGRRFNTARPDEGQSIVKMGFLRPIN